MSVYSHIQPPLIYCFHVSGLFEETGRLRLELQKAVESGSKRQMLLFRQLQECLLEVREVGNRKLEISAQMLDTVSQVGGSPGLTW